MTPLILSIETVTSAGSVAVAKGEELIASFRGDSQLSHSNTLLREVDLLLKKANVNLGDIDVFATTSGPGSFTGLRIGLATVKGFASIIDRPCAGIPSLFAIAHAGGPSAATVALMPAGRGEVFAQLLKVLPDYSVVGLDQPAHLSPKRMLDKYGELEDVLWSGEAAQLYAELINDYSARQSHASAPRLRGARFAAPVNILAEHVSALAFQSALAGGLVSADMLQALYVRPSDAEMNPKFSSNNK